MLGIKDLKKELSEMNRNISDLSGKVVSISEQISQSMDKMSDVLHETNITLRDSLQLTSDTIKDMSENFSKALEDALEKMSEFKLQMNVRDTVLKSLGLEGIVPDFMKRKGK
jgi:methyl-accepting chemotaxis protein